MSRETDNSSSGPQGRGQAGYPSGTTPYGTAAQGAAAGQGADAERQAAGTSGQPVSGSGGTPAQERRTETRLTTRVRINIPGSRPIPPVVMRTPMSDLNPPEGTAGRPSASSAATGSAQGAASHAETAQSADSAGSKLRSTPAICV